MSDLILIFIIALVSFGLRASFIAIAPGRTLPGYFEQTLVYLKPAAFAGLTAAALASHDGLGGAHFLAVIAAGWAARRSNLAIALGVGMLTYLLARPWL